MLIAELIYPESVGAERIVCSECDLSYTKEQYAVLFDSFKLGYFKVFSDELPLASAILCHDCLFDFAVDGNKDEFIEFKILTKENEYDFSFEPDEIDEFPLQDGDGSEVGLDDFLKVIINDEDS